jgi:hypothetical protein
VKTKQERREVRRKRGISVKTSKGGGRGTKKINCGRGIGVGWGKIKVCRGVG